MDRDNTAAVNTGSNEASKRRSLLSAISGDDNEQQASATAIAEDKLSWVKGVV